MDDYSSSTHKIKTLWENTIDLSNSDKLLNTVLSSLKDKTKITINLKEYLWIKGEVLPCYYNGSWSCYDEYGTQQIRLALSTKGQFVYESSWLNSSSIALIGADTSKILNLGNYIFDKFLQVYYIVEGYDLGNPINFDTENISDFPENNLIWRLFKENGFYCFRTNIPTNLKFKFILKYFKIK